MTLTLILTCTLTGIIGVLLHAGKVIAGLKKRYTTDTPKGLIKIYWQEEWLTLCLSLVVVALALLTIDEWMNLEFKGYKAVTFIRVVFVAIGYMALSVIYGLLGTVENKVKDIMESNIKDKTPI